MPVPKPHEGESQDEFMGRCMGDEVMKRDYEQEQRAGVCMSAWRERDKAMVPMDDEAHGDFMDRCTADPAMMEEHEDGDERMRACQVMWDDAGKSRRPKMSKSMKVMNCGFELKEVEERGTFEGLASVYGNVDLGGDIVRAGAFKEFVTTRDGNIRILANHDARKPIGKGKVTDTHLGLAIKGALVMESSTAREVHALMKEGIIDGLSIGYDVLPEGFEIRSDGVRELTKLKLWEVSTTVFPMNPLAQVSSVKGVEPVRSVRELEDLLRDAAGLSRAQAKLHASAIWKTVTGQRDADDEVCEAVRRTTEAIRASLPSNPT